jgi:hypothetical protein
MAAVQDDMTPVCIYQVLRSGHQIVVVPRKQRPSDLSSDRGRTLHRRALVEH